MSITHYYDVETKQFINEEVSVNSVFFSGKHNFKSFPREITYNNEQVTFIESGMRYVLQKGQKIIQLFDMSDGHSNYRLSFDSQNYTWTLLRISDLPR
ncbi:MAG: hypothetical protein QG628_756 [Patescibacteria group bacterium]|nr:hypothetical protein [Patescibacteria group bacterium]